MNNRTYTLDLISRFSADPCGHVAFELFDGKQVTQIQYTAFAGDILRAVSFFTERNITGSHIALIGANSYAWVVAFFAITASGNIAVPMNPQISPELLLYQCRKADVSAICATGTASPVLSEAFPCYTYPELMNCKEIPLSELRELQPHDTSVMLFTSGTTDENKIVELSCENLYSSIRSDDGIFSAPEIRKIMSVLPMFHISGLRGTLAMLSRFKTLCIGRSPMYLFKDLPVLSPDYVLLVPMIVESLAKLLQHLPQNHTAQTYLGSNLRRICVGGASANPQHCRYLMEQGFVIDGGYAMTETAGVGTWGQWDGAHFNTIGKLSSELLCRVEDGELLFKGPSIMKGYYKDPDATAAVIRDGWLYSGDLGYCDTDGYYYITGRKKNLIVLPNGEKVNTVELEQFFTSCPAILECLAYSKSGVICLDIYTERPEEAKAFVDHYNSTMPMSFQIHKAFCQNTPLAKTDTGKTIRKESVK